MDRHWKDRFIVSYEEITISNDNEDFKQYNLFGKDYFFIRPWFSLGGIVGHFETNFSMVNDTLNSPGVYTLNRAIRSDQSGWILGFQLMGDLENMGYSFNYISSKYLDTQAFTDEYEYETIFQDTTYNYISSAKTKFDQIGLMISKKIGKHIFRIGSSGHFFPDKNYYAHHGVWEYEGKNDLYSILSFGFGESRYAVDSHALLVNNNSDILTEYVSCNMSKRIATHWTVYGNISFHKYQFYNIPGNYNTRYLTFGLQIRF